jgi:hypothetical protein
MNESRRIPTEDGTLFTNYDHQCYTLNRAGKRGVDSVQIAVFGEEDVCAGKLVTDQARLRVTITRLQPTANRHRTVVGRKTREPF